MGVSKATLSFAGIVGATAMGIWWIHATQVEEREKLHKGVIRDEQLYRIKRAQLLAGQLHPAAAVAPAAAAAQQQQQQGR